MIKYLTVKTTNHPHVKQGEIGQLLPCSFEKYTYCAYFGDCFVMLFNNVILHKRVYYFYASEVEIWEE